MGATNSIISNNLITNIKHNKQFYIENINIRPFITITCKYEKGHANIFHLKQNKVKKIIIRNEFIMQIEYEDQSKFVTVFLENTKCIISLNENNKICFVVE